VILFVIAIIFTLRYFQSYYMKSLKASLLIVVLIIGYSNLKAQFNYIGIETYYNNMQFDRGTKGDMEDNTASNDLRLAINYIHQPIRNLGIGINIGFPITQSYKWNYTKAQTTTGLEYSEFESEFGAGSDDYFPSEYEYDIKNKIQLTFIGRLFIDIEDNIFLDLRYSSISLEEVFNFKRSASLNRGFGPDIPALNLSSSNTFNASGFGIGIGASPRISDHFYAGYSFSLDFLEVNDRSFRYVIPYSDFNSDKSSAVIMDSKINGPVTVYNLNISFGYIF